MTVYSHFFYCICLQVFLVWTALLLTFSLLRSLEPSFKLAVWLHTWCCWLDEAYRQPRDPTSVHSGPVVRLRD